MDSFELSQWEIYINKLQEEIKALKECIKPLTEEFAVKMQDKEKDMIEFAKVYHNHVMETAQPPFHKRLNIQELLQQFKEEPKQRPVIIT